MPDDEMPKGSGRYRILLGEDRDVEYWIRHLKVNRAKLEKAVRRVGPGVDAVKHHLRSENASDD